MRGGTFLQLFCRKLEGTGLRPFKDNLPLFVSIREPQQGDVVDIVLHIGVMPSGIDLSVVNAANQDVKSFKHVVRSDDVGVHIRLLCSSNGVAEVRMAGLKSIPNELLVDSSHQNVTVRPESYGLPAAKPDESWVLWENAYVTHHDLAVILGVLLIHFSDTCRNLVHLLEYQYRTAAEHWMSNDRAEDCASILRWICAATRTADSRTPWALSLNYMSASFLEHAYGLLQFEGLRFAPARRAEEYYDSIESSLDEVRTLEQQLEAYYNKLEILKKQDQTNKKIETLGRGLSSALQTSGAQYAELQKVSQNRYDVTLEGYNEVVEKFKVRHFIV